MRKNFLVLSLISLFALSIILAGTSESKTIKDEYKEHVNVSGSLFVGAMFHSDKDKNTFEDIHIFVPDKNVLQSNKVCLEISSVDGKYEGLFEVSVSIGEGNTSKIELESKYKKEIHNYQTEEMVILASVKSDCQAPDTENIYLLTSWGEIKDSPPVDVFLNTTIRSLAYEAIFDDDTNTKGKCVYTEFQNNIAYNRKCSMDLDWSRVAKLRFLIKELGESVNRKALKLSVN